MKERKNMPIGIQTFEKIFEKKCAYVDKTQFVYRLAERGTYYFLSRPRRFGKSLFLSTLESYFLGKKELFAGLALESLETAGAKKEEREAWQVYPVIKIDFNAANYKEDGALEKLLNSILLRYEEKYEVKTLGETLAIRFTNIIQAAYKKTKKQVVILVDEYDRPLLETLENKELFDKNRENLKAFFLNLKSEDEHIRFAFLTGVTKFAHVTVFSGLNNLNDISLDEEYNSICGISESELIENFKTEIELLAEKNQLTYEECLAKLKKTYDGYHFGKNTEGIYNPFSLLNTFEKLDFRYYWFESGTPSFLIRAIEKENIDIREIAQGISLAPESFSQYRYDQASVEPLLYQSGYLTIKGYDREFNSYLLDFPNEEVRVGFLRNLLPTKTLIDESQTGFFIEHFVKDIRSGNVDSFMTRLQSIMYSVPYTVYGEKKNVTEQTFQIAIFLIFQLMGLYTQAEVHSAKGRADAVVTTKDAVYVFEFKLNGTKEDALSQIDQKGYAIQYNAEGKKIVKIGVGFEKDAPVIKDWIVG